MLPVLADQACGHSAAFWSFFSSSGRSVSSAVRRTYTDQAELGDFLLEQLRLGAAPSASDHSLVAA